MRLRSCWSDSCTDDDDGDEHDVITHDVIQQRHLEGKQLIGRGLDAALHACQLHLASDAAPTMTMDNAVA